MNLEGRLLAKSWHNKYGNPEDCPWIFLRNHLASVYTAAEHVLEHTGDLQLQALQLPKDIWGKRLRSVVLLAAALHDLGKANTHFQEMLRGQRRFQGLRHEWVAFLILQDENMWRWLAPAVDQSNTDWRIILWAITGHHPAYGRPSPPRIAAERVGSEITVFTGNTDFHQCLDWIGRVFQLDPSDRPVFRENKLLTLIGSNSVFTNIFKYHVQDKKLWHQLGEEEKRFTAAVKNCLIAADVAGSALPKQLGDESSLHRWIAQAFGRIPSSEQISEIINERLKDSETGKTYKLRLFQQKIAESEADVTLVTAGCGSGKTLAAYNWSRIRCPNKRVYFCYPTTGTATEGFRDYLYNPDDKAGVAGAELFHGRASVDLEILSNVDGDQGNGASGVSETDEFAKIQALETWFTPIVSCTVDTVLGLIQNNRRGLYTWPTIAISAFVFDEIHAYDDKLFGALVRFIQAFSGVPILLMTASLPEHRRKALQDCVQYNGTKLREIPKTPDLLELEERPRYHIQNATDIRTPISEVTAEIKEGGKVLWVCNTVNRAINAYDQANAAGLNPILYHSRFRYEDRVSQHASVISTFHQGKNGSSALAICTQVAEMSLDLSATLLVTEIAPVPALIQRLGRLNRRAKAGDATRPFIVLEPLTERGSSAVLPYNAEEIAPAKEWLKRLPDEQISQADLADTWKAVCDGRNTRVTHVSSAWLDGGPVTQVLELRESSPGITVLLEEDAAVVADGTKHVTSAVLPMPPPPRHMVWRDWSTVKGIPVAPTGTIDYNKQRGGIWQKPNQ